MSSRTFTILPPKSDPLLTRWIPAPNTIATDEIAAHIGMFNPRDSDGFYDLGLAVVRMLGNRIDEYRPCDHGDEEDPEKTTAAVDDLLL